MVSTSELSCARADMLAMCIQYRASYFGASIILSQRFSKPHYIKYRCDASCYRLIFQALLIQLYAVRPQVAPCIAIAHYWFKGKEDCESPWDLRAPKAYDLYVPRSFRIQ